MKNSIPAYLWDSSKENRQKFLEKQELPLQIPDDVWFGMRFDGRAFSKNVPKNGFDPFFDQHFSSCMHEAARYLLLKTDAALVYTQSDEITAYFPPMTDGRERMFGGKIQKLLSVYTSMVSNKFNQTALRLGPSFETDTPDTIKFSLTALSEYQFMEFDARIVVFPSFQLCLENLVWRNKDAIRNAILRVAHKEYGHSEIQGRSVNFLRNRLKKDEIWAGYMKRLPVYYWYGIAMRQVTVEEKMDSETWSSIPARHRGSEPPMVRRKRVHEVPVRDWGREKDAFLHFQGDEL